MKAFFITETGKCEFREIAKASIKNDDDVLIKVEYVGACGSDINTFRGMNPMVQLPRIPGHEIAGIVAEKGKNVPDNIKIGTQVTVLPYTSCGECSSCRSGRFNCCRYNQTMGVQRDGAMTEYIVAPFQKILSSKQLSLTQLALVEPLTIGFHAVERAAVKNGDIIMVYGCGAIGTGALIGSAELNAKIIAVDIDDEKLAKVKQILPQAVTINSQKENLHEKLQELSAGQGPDVVIEAVGSPLTFRSAVDEVAFAGRVVYIGYTRKNVEYETKYFVQKELDIRGSRNASPANFLNVIAMMEKKTIPFEKIITRIYPFKEAVQAFSDWNSNPELYTKILFKMD